MDAPGLIPEILTTPSGPIFNVQYLKETYLLSALHTISDTLSVSFFLSIKNILKIIKFY